MFNPTQGPYVSPGVMTFLELLVKGVRVGITLICPYCPRAVPLEVFTKLVQGQLP
jgi:hypothetical protein